MNLISEMFKEFDKFTVKDKESVLNIATFLSSKQQNEHNQELVLDPPLKNS